VHRVEVFAEKLRHFAQPHLRFARKTLHVFANHLDGQNAKRHGGEKYQKYDDLPLCEAEIEQKAQRADDLKRLAENFRRERKQDGLDGGGVVGKTREKVARCEFVEEGDGVALYAVEDVLLQTPKNFERRIGHQIAAEIAEYRPERENRRQEHCHADNIPSRARRRALIHKYLAQYLVENDGHTEAAARAEERAENNRGDKLRKTGLQVNVKSQKLSHK